MHAIQMPFSLIRHRSVRRHAAAILLVLMSTLGSGMMPSLSHADPHQAVAFEQGCVHVDGTLSNAFNGHSNDGNCCAGMGALCTFHCTHVFMAPMALPHGGTGASMPMAVYVSLSTQTFPVPPWHPPKAA